MTYQPYQVRCEDCGHHKAVMRYEYMAELCDFCFKWPTRARRPDLYPGQQVRELVR